MALGLTAAALAGPTQAWADAGAKVTVNAKDAPNPFVSVGDMIDDVDVSPNPIARWWPYDDRPVTVDVAGTSAKELVRLAGVDPETLSDASAMVVSNPNPGGGVGGTSTLSKDQILEGFANPLDPSVPNGSATFGWFEEQDQVRYTAPMVGATQRSDFIALSQNASITVNLSVPAAVKVLSVSGSADPSRVKVGQAVQFEAVPGGAASGWTYAWDFGDETSSPAASSRSAEHTYADDGTYFARVTARDGPDGGVSKLIRVEVEPAAGKSGDTQPAAPGSSSDPGAPATGTGSAGKKAVSAGPNRSRQKRSSPGADRSSAARSGAGGSGAGGSGGGGSGRGATGTGGAARSASGAHSGGEAARGGSGQRTTSRGAGRVDGVLLAGGGDVYSAADVSKSEVERAQQAARAGRGTAGGWPAWVGGGALLLALLASGVALEIVPRSGPELVYP